jgi:predicted RNase H-like nuclease
VHLVPVAADLSDLADKLAWCQSQPDACRAIAAAGHRLGLEVVAELEQDQRRAVLQWAKQWMEPAAGIRPIG